jgi:hypothetical protein
MSDKSMEVQSKRLINSPLSDILSGFREVLNKYGTPDSTVIEFTFIDHKSEQEGAMVVPKGVSINAGTIKRLTQLNAALCVAFNRLTS